MQFTVPGAPTIYYGDEVGMTGSDDPDDRRTFPVERLRAGRRSGTSSPHYRQMATIRKENPVFRNGTLTFLLTDDANRTLAYGMKTAGQVAIVAINRSETRPADAHHPTGGLPARRRHASTMCWAVQHATVGRTAA